MVAWVTGLAPNEFIHCMGDTHVYKDHFIPLQEQCSRVPKTFPKLTIREEMGETLAERKEWSIEKCLNVMEEMEMDRFVLDGYAPAGKIVMKMSA